MGDMLSQAEIDALLNGTMTFDTTNNDEDESLDANEKDALGEIGNISMGTSATTLNTLLGQKVLITTPKVTITSWEELAQAYVSSHVAVRVEYTHGLIGSNLLILKEDDVKIITDLMMGGEGINISGELTDLHLSAISEAMNQMIGSSATSMSSMFDKRIDISPPKAFIINFSMPQPYPDFDHSQKIVKVAFKMEIGNLVDSEIMQILPIKFAKTLVDNLLTMDMGGNVQPAMPASALPPKIEQPVRAQPGPASPSPQSTYASPYPPRNSYAEETYYTPDPVYQQPAKQKPPVHVHPAQFESFDEGRIAVEKKNISLIMDVPLEVTVELGRTQRAIKDILEFGPGSVIELDKLAGEPVDILVNGKPIAKGEVVVIDESFGVRITDILHPSRRL